MTFQRLATFVCRFACPGFLRKEITVLSSSQATPVCACPARRPRWCPLDLPSHLKDYAFRLVQDVGFPRLSSAYPLGPQKVSFSGLSHAAYTLATPGFTHTLAA